MVKRFRVFGSRACGLGRALQGPSFKIHLEIQDVLSSIMSGTSNPMIAILRDPHRLISRS